MDYPTVFLISARDYSFLYFLCNRQVINTPITKQNQDNKIESGQTVNLLIKLDNKNPDLQLSKTIRAQFNIGANQLSEFLIESGGAQ